MTGSDMGSGRVFKCSRCGYQLWDACLEDVDAHWATEHAPSCPDPDCLYIYVHPGDHVVSPGHPKINRPAS
jgi:hypothetical protein